MITVVKLQQQYAFLVLKAKMLVLYQDHAKSLNARMLDILNHIFVSFVVVITEHFMDHILSFTVLVELHFMLLVFQHSRCF
jgi:hypothetical protein